jgi:hypothetical protein
MKPKGLVPRSQEPACIQPHHTPTKHATVQKLIFIQGPAEIPDEFVKQMWVEPLA